ncbi:ATP-binding protein [Bifidobacterium eulemuris]|uniref:ATP-binding protein n=1 Tax=Bifidobacterium eulemuris TaxID=1765219 RepID=A0A261G3L3_9BIFI|nr:AAA family ATPase [Bifidobacterium eulemuris]OZG66014.1 ATPase AAA [Bifidobacterium eulemuris]QOL32067.1 ATP-binding protein [Bifidobacterium eulemuris]
MLRRKAMERFRFWKEHKTKQALLVTGARQVGKSTLIRAFAEESYDHVVMFDLVENMRARDSFAQAQSAQDLELRMSVMSDVDMIPGNTVVIVDEVQECPQIVTFIKYLVDKGDYDFILSGSMLGVALDNIRSIPVGYLTEVRMFSLDFEEFCWANGVPATAFDMLRQCVSQCEPIPDYLHNRFTDVFKRYLLVGGMPDAVNAFLGSNDIGQVRVIQNDLRRYYREDISKYAPKDRRLVIQNIYDLVPSELLHSSRRFHLRSIEGVKRFTQVQDEFLWLTNAGVALAQYNIAELAPPFLLSENRNKIKLFYSDVGLLTGAYSKELSRDILDDQPSVNLGSTYENFVVQELAAHGFQTHYYQSKAIGEIDAAIERADGTVTVFEVKSGKGYRSHAALDNALASSNCQVDEAYVLYNGNIEIAESVTYLPVYSAGLFSAE